MTRGPASSTGEIDTLIAAVEASLDHVHAGRLAAGYSLLLAGLKRAEAQRDAGRPWGAGAVRRWRYAVEACCREYGARRAPGQEMQCDPPLWHPGNNGITLHS